MSTDILHRELVDLDTLLQRKALTNTIVEALFYDPGWKSVCDLAIHTKTASRIAFQRYRLGDLYAHGGVSLRNRVEGRP